jgi:hypothetical protein
MGTYIIGNKEFDFDTKKRIYEGDFHNGKRHGEGKLYEEVLYIGMFKDGYKQGRGKEYSRETGKWLYKGDFENNNRHGFGIERTSKIIYKGSFINGKRQGYGKVYDINTKKLLYQGDFHQDRRHGNGELFFPNACYEGTFVDGLFIEGNEYTLNQEKELVLTYSGEFLRLKKHGKGIEYDFNTGHVSYIGIYGLNKRIKGKEVNPYNNHCHSCKREINTWNNDPCFKCFWLKCLCGSCGCNYSRKWY